VIVVLSLRKKIIYYGDIAMENPLSVILVKSDSKGDRLLFRFVGLFVKEKDAHYCKFYCLSFRYPYIPPSVDESSKQKKRHNPYSIGLIEDTHQNLESSPSGIGDMSDEVLSSLFACKTVSSTLTSPEMFSYLSFVQQQNLSNQKFELKINDTRFVSHPALMENKNSFILINIVFALQAQCSYSIGETFTNAKLVCDNN
jgi:nitrogen permease regulator 3-like protein